MNRSHPRCAAALASCSALALILDACSPAPAPVSRSTNDPSNPCAAEGASPLAASSAAPVEPMPSPPNPMTHHAGHGAAATQSAPADAGAVVYVCPMHPEVTSSSPGRCPKCGMQLVPKK